MNTIVTKSKIQKNQNVDISSPQMSHKKFGPDRFRRFDVYWIQTNRQTDKPNLYIEDDESLTVVLSFLQRTFTSVIYVVTQLQIANFLNGNYFCYMAILKLATYMKSFFSRNHIDLDRISNNCEIICCNLYREHGIINHENILKEAFYIAERS